MADNVTNELLLEHMKAMHGRLEQIASDIGDLKIDMRGIKTHMGAFLTSEAAQDGAIAGLSLRLERIEKRLGLADPTV